MNHIIYDSEALIAAERNDRAFWADHMVRLEQGTIPVAPGPVVAQVSRSSRQAQLRRLLRGCDVTTLDEDTAHRVGSILAQAGTADIVDASVAFEALRLSGSVVSSDRDDIAHLLQAAGAELSVIEDNKTHGQGSRA